jgi:predicted DNA binding protein
MATAKVDARGAFRKLKEAEKSMLRGSYRTVRNLAKIGVAHAASIAPYDKGNTARAIHAKPAEQGQGWVKWVIYAPDVYPEAAARLGGLVRYMHEEGSSRFHTGDSKFMYSTRDYLNSIKKRVAQGNFELKAINIGR